MAIRSEALSGGDALVGRLLYHDQFTFNPTHKIWLSTTYKPDIRGQDEAIWNRLKLIPFEVRFVGKKRDKRLLDKLLRELPGVLAWGVRGAIAWWNMSP